MPRLFDNENYSIHGPNNSVINPRTIRIVAFVILGLCALYLITSPFHASSRSETSLDDDKVVNSQPLKPIPRPEVPITAPPQPTISKEFDFELLLKKDPSALNASEKAYLTQYYEKLVKTGIITPSTSPESPKSTLGQEKRAQTPQTPVKQPQNPHPPQPSSTAFHPSIPPLFDGHEIVVTLTTIPDRMKYLNATLLSLVSQTIPPTEIVLNIPYLSRRFSNPDGTPLVYDLPLEFIRYIHALGAINPNDPRTFLNHASSQPNSPTSAINAQNKHHKDSDGYINPNDLDFEPVSFPYSFANLTRVPRITIHRCDDDGPATKLLPTLAREFAIGRLDSILMIADDDVIYPPNWVESMVGYYLSRPELRYSAVGARGYCAPPSNVWEWRIISQIAISAQQLYNITKNLNTPFKTDPVTGQRVQSIGSTLEEDHRTLVTPNAHRFIYRQHNYTTVLQTGAQTIYQEPPNYGASLQQKQDDENEEEPQGELNDGTWQENDDLRTKVVMNEDWMFAYLFNDKHPSYVKNSYHKHTTDDVVGTLDDIQKFLDDHVGYNVYTPSDRHIESLLPYTKHDQKFMSHTPVDVISGNNGFLIRPYYFLRYSPFIGNITRVFVEQYEMTSFNKFQTRRENFLYTTANNMWGKHRQFYTSEYQRVHDLLVDKDGNAPKTATTDDVNLSEYAKHLKYVLTEGDKIYISRQAAIQKAFEDAIEKQKKEEEEKKARWTSRSNTGQINTPTTNPKCTHPELDESKMSAFEYHIAHLNLHNKLDQIQFENAKHDDILHQYSQDKILQAEELTSPLTNIVPFGSFGPYNRDEFEKGVAAKLDADFRKDPSGRLSAKASNPMFDFSQNTRNLGVLGSNGQVLPDSVYYMDDIWFNGILAANNVSRVVISMTTDPVHRPKMQSQTTTLEQVPVGRSYHNNVLLKAFEQYWTNCPYIASNITIPQFYLRYYALSGQTVEEQRDQALNEGKKDANQTTTKANLDDYRNQWSNPWQGWGVKDNETNVSTQYFFSPFVKDKTGEGKKKASQRPGMGHDLPSGSLPVSQFPDSVTRKPPGSDNNNGNDILVKDDEQEGVDFTKPEAKVNAGNVNDFFKQLKKQHKDKLNEIEAEAKEKNKANSNNSKTTLSGESQSTSTYTKHKPNHDDV